MVAQKEIILDAGAEEKVASTSQPDEQNKQEAQKKHHTKRYVFFIFVLGVGAWLFWSLSSQPQNIQQQGDTLTYTPKQHIPVKTQVPNIQQPTLVAPQKHITAKSEAAEDSPIFETIETQPALNIISSSQDKQTISNAENTNKVIPVLHDLQQQIIDLTRVISTMQQQQQQWSQQQVRAQLFALLQQAANPKTRLNDVLLAWKGISFLPLLSQDKRTTAQQAADSLQNAQQRIQQTSALISQLIQTLATQLHPKALQDIERTIEDITPIEQPDSLNTGWHWLKQQFIITKLDKHAPELSDDPYADIKQLMTQLNELKHNINQQAWADIGSLTGVLYQLEQHNLDTPFSNESITQLQQAIEIWQQEAQVWMGQL